MQDEFKDCPAAAIQKVTPTPLTSSKMAEIVEERRLRSIGQLDQILGRVMSRKLLVFLFATIFYTLGTLGLAFADVTFDGWAAIAFAYIGMQGVVDIAATWRQSKK